LTNKFFEGQDIFAEWLEEATEINSAHRERSAKLFQSWREFALARNEDPGNYRAFAEQMRRAGFEAPDIHKFDGKSARGYIGLRLRL